ncbi:MAG: hypothetical protein Q8P63_01460 [Candidatus Nealsonbacteria bacterium]|nr:hypothetical protein [Candidatus Nealsonbacteria bacterium]
MRLRNQYYGLFRKKLLVKKLAERKGECRHCGTCCRVMQLGFKCRFFDEKTNNCRLYGTKLMPRSCKSYPFDLENSCRDKITEIREKCGYYWEADK